MLTRDAPSPPHTGSLWACGSLQLLVGTGGHAPPSDKSWRLKNARFTLSDMESGRRGEGGE
jgi:hypothetical protein